MATFDRLHGGRCGIGRRGAVALAAACLLGGTPAPAAEAGRIVGRIVLGVKMAERRFPFGLYADGRRVAAAPSPRSLADEFENVVVYVEAVGAGAVPARSREQARVVRQEDLTFSPHVTPVLKGESVEFQNADPLFHNVFSLSKAATFDLGRYPSGKSRSVRFTSPGVVKVFCHIHSDMSAIVLVLDNPFFAVPDRDGRFALDPLPPGEYRVIAWHERAKPVTRTVRVAPGVDVEVAFEIPLRDEEKRGE